MTELKAYLCDCGCGENTGPIQAYEQPRNWLTLFGWDVGPLHFRSQACLIQFSLERQDSARPAVRRS